MESVPPSSSTISRTAVLILRVLTFVFLLIALVVISVTKQTLYVGGVVPVEIKFNDVYAYRYMMATIVIGFVYNLFQLALSICNKISGKRVIRGNVGYLFDFYGDKLISYLLATGAAAAFGFTQDLRSGGSLNFFDKASASASLLLLGFLCTAIASVFSSYALPQKPYIHY